jgi:predicted nucleic acid-binding protein
VTSEQPVLHIGARTLFVDTSAFFASSNRRDLNFLAARRVLARAERQRLRLLTTTFIVAEAHALFLSRLGRTAGVGFLQFVADSEIVLIRPHESDEQTAREIIYRYTDKDFSLTDAISFAVMERLGITTAFTFDRDFTQYGFATAQP